MKTSALIITVGIVIILIGILWQFGIKLGMLPGDISVEKGSFKFYFPIVTSIILSILITLFIFAYQFFNR